jgi:hypothetical protein
VNPLLVAVSDPFTKTEAGKHNVQNIQDAFDCDLITVDVSVDTSAGWCGLHSKNSGALSSRLTGRSTVFPCRWVSNSTSP